MLYLKEQGNKEENLFDNRISLAKVMGKRDQVALKY